MFFTTITATGALRTNKGYAKLQRGLKQSGSTGVWLACQHKSPRCLTATVFLIQLWSLESIRNENVWIFGRYNLIDKPQAEFMANELQIYHLGPKQVIENRPVTYLSVTKNPNTWLVSLTDTGTDAAWCSLLIFKNKLRAYLTTPSPNLLARKHVLGQLIAIYHFWLLHG